MLSTIEIEDKFNRFLQKDVEFLLEDKSIKNGKLMLFSIKSFYFTFILSAEGRNKHINFEIPYPFLINFLPDQVNFNYHSKNLFRGNIDVECRSLLYSYKRPLRYFQNEIIMKCRQ